MTYWSGLYPEDVQQIIRRGADAMLQAAIQVMARQGRCIMLPLPEAQVATEETGEDGVRDENEAAWYKTAGQRQDMSCLFLVLVISS